MGRTASLLSFSLLLVACGGRYRDGAGGAGGASPNGAGSPSAGGAGRFVEVAGGGGSGGNAAAAGGANANAAGGAAPQPARPDYCENVSAYTCCNRDTGDVYWTTCGPDDRWLPCTGNSFHPNGEPACMPDSVSVADCQELEGLACEPGNECHNFRSCSTFCTCEEVGGVYHWKCLDYAC